MSFPWITLLPMIIEELKIVKYFNFYVKLIVMQDKIDNWYPRWKMLKFYFHGNDGVDGEYQGPLMSPYQIFIIVQNCLNVIKQIKNNAGSKEGGYLKAAYSPKDQKVIFRSDL